MTTKRLTYLTATCILALAATNCSNDEVPVFPTDIGYCHYMPLSLTNKWVYEVRVESKYDPPDDYELTYEVTTTKKNYNGYTTAYVITITKNGASYGELTAVNDGDAFLVERAMWSYVMADGMELGGWSQSGLVDAYPLEYQRNETINVPAGTFPNCRTLVFDNDDQFQPENWKEWYANDVGVVRYHYSRKEYESSPPYGLLDWRTVDYRLDSFEVEPAPSP